MQSWKRVEIRLSVYSLLLFILYLGIIISGTISDIRAVDKSPSPFGIDFAVYYTSGRMVISGEGQNIYNEAIHHAALENLLNRTIPFSVPWVYPPTFLLVIVPLSYLPYYPALALWTLLTFSLALIGIYSLVPREKLFANLLPGFPGVFLNLRWGQNGFLNTALLSFGFSFMNRNPVLSGLMFGLLTYKPQIAFFPLLFLFLAKEWKTLFWSAIFTVSNAVLSLIVFGQNLWLAFLQNFFSSSSLLLSSIWETTAAIQPTLFSALRIWGVEGVPLLISLSLVACFALMAALWIWKNTNRPAIRYSVIIVGLLLAIPYYVQYDLILLSIPLILLADDFKTYGCQKTEIILLALLWLMTLLNWPLVAYTRIQVMPLVLGATMIMLCLRAKPVKVCIPSTKD